MIIIARIIIIIIIIITPLRGRPQPTWPNRLILIIISKKKNNNKPIWPTWYVGALFRGARHTHISL
jgi:hypothetical protein